MVGDETYSISRKKACDVFNGTPVGRAVDFRFWPASAVLLTRFRWPQRPHFDYPHRTSRRGHGGLLDDG